MRASGNERVSPLGVSFGGDACACYAAKGRAEVDRLMLSNPQLDYKRRTIDSRPDWHDDMEAWRLSELGYLQFTPTLRHGCPIIKEPSCFEAAVLGEITVPRTRSPWSRARGRRCRC